MSPTAHSVFYASLKSIEKHWGLLRASLTEVLPKAGGKYWIEPSLISGVDGNLYCDNYNHERALRERGAEIPVVPLVLTRSREVYYWVSLHQSWSEPFLSTEKNFLYHTTGITVFYGKEYDKEKAQLFRAEWPGMRQMSDGSVEFEARGAGHPHWQFDAYQYHLRERRKQQERSNELELLLQEQQPEAVDFTDFVFPDSAHETESELMAHVQRLARMHFASSTRWAENPWSGRASDVRAHAQAPASLDEIFNWITSTMSYIQQEATR